jgi:hypothetical protein
MGLNIRKGWGSMGFQRWIDHSSAFCWSLHPNSGIAPVWHSMAIMASQSAWTNLRRRHPLFSSESQHCTLQAQAEKIWGAQGNGGGKGSYPTSRCLTNQNGKGIWEKDRKRAKDAKVWVETKVLSPCKAQKGPFFASVALSSMQRFIHPIPKGVPPRGLSCHQLFRLCLGFEKGFLCWVSCWVFRVFTKVLTSFTFKAYLGFHVRFRLRVLWKQVSSAIWPFSRHPKMHKTLALRSQNALPRAAPPSGRNPIQIQVESTIYSSTIPL